MAWKPSANRQHKPTVEREQIGASSEIATIAGARIGVYNRMGHFFRRNASH
jgi:hypothetical protein